MVPGEPSVGRFICSDEDAIVGIFDTVPPSEVISIDNGKGMASVSKTFSVTIGVSDVDGAVIVVGSISRRTGTSVDTAGIDDERSGLEPPLVAAEVGQQADGCLIELTVDIRREGKLGGITDFSQLLNRIDRIVAGTKHGIGVDDVAFKEDAVCIKNVGGQLNDATGNLIFTDLGRVSEAGRDEGKRIGAAGNSVIVIVGIGSNAHDKLALEAKTGGCLGRVTRLS